MTVPFQSTVSPGTLSCRPRMYSPDSGSMYVLSQRMSRIIGFERLMYTPVVFGVLSRAWHCSIDAETSFPVCRGKTAIPYRLFLHSRWSSSWYGRGL